MPRILLLDNQLLRITIDRLCHELVEKHEDFGQSVILGMQPRGRFLADRIHARLNYLFGIELPIGYLDTTFYRDDFRRRAEPLKANVNHIPFLIEGKRVILVDDVLFTGRTVRAALSAMAEFGRPQSVELVTLIDRQYSRDLPIQPDYIGKKVSTILSQKVIVEWCEQGFEEDRIWLISQEN